MKTLLLILVIGFSLIALSFGQVLSENYKSEIINLEEVVEFGADNNWEDLFSDYHNEWMGKEVGKIKSIVIAPDGSIFMSHKTHYEIWKFDKKGQFIKSIGSKGNGKGQFVMRPRVEGVLDGKYMYTTDNQGRMMFFDLEGNYVKSLKLNYLPLRTVPLNDLKIAIFGHVPWKGNTTRKIVAIKDFDTGNEQIIWSEIYDYSDNVIELPSGKKMIATMKFDHPSVTRFGMASTPDGNLLLASHSEDAIYEYSTSGEKVFSFPLNIKPVEITEEDINRVYQAKLANIDKVQKKLPEKRKLSDEELEIIRRRFQENFESVRDQIKAGVHLPVYSTVIIDSEGNIIVFRFTEEKGANRFSAYSYDKKGEFIGESSFVSAEFNLTFIQDRFEFHNGYVYAIATMKDVEGVPLRLVKFRLVKQSESK